MEIVIELTEAERRDSISSKLDSTSPEDTETPVLNGHSTCVAEIVNGDAKGHNSTYTNGHVDSGGDGTGIAVISGQSNGHSSMVNNAFHDSTLSLAHSLHSNSYHHLHPTESVRLESQCNGRRHSKPRPSVHSVRYGDDDPRPFRHLVIDCSAMAFIDPQGVKILKLVRQDRMMTTVI